MEPITMWPQMDFIQLDGQMQQQQQGNVFMGATTPQGGNLM